MSILTSIQKLYYFLARALLSPHGQGPYALFTLGIKTYAFSLSGTSKRDMNHTVVFAALGAGLACYSNVIRKLPMLRRPWEHVAYFAIGGYVGSLVPEFKENQKRELEKTLAARDNRLEERAKRIAAKQALTGPSIE